MNDTEPVVVAERSASGAFIAAVIIAALLGIGALGWCYSLQNRITAAEQSLAAADKKNVELADRLDATNARLRATADTLGQNVGATQKQIDARTEVILAAQKAQNAETAKLAQQQQSAESRSVLCPATSPASRRMWAASRPTWPPPAATSKTPRRSSSAS